MNFTKLTGTALQSAELYIARYCLQLEGQSGSIDIAYAVKVINDEYRLVPEHALAKLASDISYAFGYLKNQQLGEMSRAGYWKFKALSPFEAKQALHDNLVPLIT